MNNQEPELKPMPPETNSAQTNESIQFSRPEIPMDERPCSLYRKSSTACAETARTKLVRTAGMKPMGTRLERIILFLLYLILALAAAHG